MLKIFICEDNEKQKNKINKIIKDILATENFDMDIVLSTINPKEVIDYLSKDSVSGLYFLDVDLNNSINGIVLAAEIRKFDPWGTIVFITTRSEMSYLTFEYKVEAMDYIIKDDFNKVHERIHKCIVKAQEKFLSKGVEFNKKFVFRTDDRVISLDYDKILFFETAHKNRRVIIHAVDRQVEFHGLMKDVEEKLDERFYRCHKSFIVNKENIKEVDIKNRILIMINGEECFISVRELKHFRNWDSSKVFINKITKLSF